MFRRPLFVLFLLVFLLPGAAQAGDEAKALFEKGETLLKAGDLDGALQAYKEAAEKDPENKKYASKALILTRVVLAKDFVDSTGISPKWEKTAASLHTFYLHNGIYKEALALDRMVHKKLNSDTSTAFLAETLLEMNKNEEALKLLKEREKLILQNRLYLGIALARLGRMEEARRLEKETLLPDDTDAGNLFEAARFKTLLGNHKNALFLLTLCLEKTPKDQHERVKTFIKRCRDLKPLMESEKFKDVMVTKSKVKR